MNPAATLPPDIHAAYFATPYSAVESDPAVVEASSDLEVATRDYDAISADATNERTLRARVDDEERAREVEVEALKANLPALAAGALRGGDDSEYNRVAERIAAIERKRAIYRDGRPLLKARAAELQRAIDEPASRKTDCTARLAAAIHGAKVAIATQRVRG